MTRLEQWQNWKLPLALVVSTFTGYNVSINMLGVSGSSWQRKALRPSSLVLLSNCSSIAKASSGIVTENMFRLINIMLLP